MSMRHKNNCLQSIDLNVTAVNFNLFSHSVANLLKAYETGPNNIMLRLHVSCIYLAHKPHRFISFISKACLCF